MEKKLIYVLLENPCPADYIIIHNQIIQVAIGYAKIHNGFYLTKTHISSINIRESISMLRIQGTISKILIANWEHSTAWIGLDIDVNNWIRNA